MKNLFKKTAAGVFVAGLTFGFAPAAVAADATPACWVDAVEQAEINYSKQNGIKVQAEAEKADAAAKKADAEKRVAAKTKAIASAQNHFDNAKTQDEVKLYTSILNMTKKQLDAASQDLKEASYDVQAAEDTIALQTNMLKTASDALNKVQNADPAAYNKAHGCKAAPAKPDQKPGKDMKPGKDGKADNKAQNAKKDGKKAPVKAKKNAKKGKGLAHTGAVAASLAGLAVASVAGGTGVVAWRRRKA